MMIAFCDDESGDRSYSTPESSPNAEELRPIIITLAHPENHGGSSYLLISAAKSKGGRGSDSHKRK